MFEHEIARAEPILARYGYAAVFAATFLEGFGIPAPGQTLLIAAAVLAARGEMSLPILLVTAFAASAGGTLVGWAIGRTGGKRVLDRLAGKRLDRIEALFARWGGGLVAFGRFLDGARQLAGIAGGAFGMPLAPFLLWNTLGAVVWTAFWGGGAFAFTRDFHTLASLAHRARVPLLAASLVAAAALLLWLARGRTPQPPTP